MPAALGWTPDTRVSAFKLPENMLTCKSALSAFLKDDWHVELFQDCSIRLYGSSNPSLRRVEVEYPFHERYISISNDELVCLTKKRIMTRTERICAEAAKAALAGEWVDNVLPSEESSSVESSERDSSSELGLSASHFETVCLHEAFEWMFYSGRLISQRVNVK